MSTGSKSLLSSALAGDGGLATTSSSMSTGSVLADSLQRAGPDGPLLSANQLPVPRSSRRSSLTEMQMDSSYPPVGLSRLVLDRRSSSNSVAGSAVERPAVPFRRVSNSAGSLSGDSTFSVGARQTKLERLQVETISRFLISAAGLAHALQAERGASVTYVASFGQTMCDKIPSFHDTTNRRLRKLGDALTLYEDLKVVNVQNIEALRQAVLMRTLSYDQVIGMYNTMVQALLDTMAVASRPLQHTEVSQKVTSLLIFQRMKEAAALQRGTVSGMAASGELMIKPRLYYALLNNLANMDAYSAAFKMLVDPEIFPMFSEHNANTPSMILEFENRLRTSKQDVEAMLLTISPESWFACNSERMDGLNMIEERIVGAIEEMARIICQDQDLALQLSSLPGSPVLSQPGSPSTSRFCTSPFSPKTFNVDSMGIIGKDFNIPIQRLSLAEKIGGSTYCGAWNGSIVAVKEVTEAAVGGKQALVSILRDVSEESRFRHPNICAVYGVSIASDRYNIVMEYMDLGSLWHQLHHDRSSVSFFETATHITRGLQYLHEMAGHVHADLTSSNILTSSYGTTKIKTVIARKMDEAQRCSWRYFAPEVLLEDCWTYSSDIYSLGILLWELLTKEIPYSSFKEGPNELQEKIGSGELRPPLPVQTPEPIAALITHCWEQDSSMRPSASHVLKELENCKTTLNDFECQFLNSPHPSCFSDMRPSMDGANSGWNSHDDMSQRSDNSQV